MGLGAIGVVDKEEGGSACHQGHWMREGGWRLLRLWLLTLECPQTEGCLEHSEDILSLLTLEQAGG